MADNLIPSPRCKPWMQSRPWRDFDADPEAAKVEASVPVIPQ